MIDRGLPANLDSERLVLGSILLDHQAHAVVFGLLAPEDFSLDVHRKIYAAMHGMDAVGIKIDYVALAGRLSDQGKLEAVGGLTRLVGLTEGLPNLPNVESHVSLVREKSALRKIIYAARDLANRCMVADTASADLIALADHTLSGIGYQQSVTAELLDPGEIVERAGGLEMFINPKQGAGVKTPWDRLTEMTCGYRRGELVVVAGNPSHGKSAASLQIAMAVAEVGLGVLVFSLEMSRASLVQRMACCRGRVDSARLRAGYLNAEERMRLRIAISELSRWPLWIAEHGVSTVSAIRSALRKKRAKSPVFMVVIDYLQLLQGIGRQPNRNAEISEITRGLKLLAVDEQVNVQLLSQLNRDNLKEKRAPALHDLRESGSIEQDADATMFVWRPERLWREREDLRGMAELLLLKQRSGPTGKIDLVWLEQFTRFESRADGMPPAVGGEKRQSRFDHDDD